MAHFGLLWKARTIEKYRQNYENEKINSIVIFNSDVPDKTLFQRWRHYRHGMQKRLSRTFSKWYPAGSTVSNFFVSLKTDMKLPSILLRSLYGFLGGLLLTYLGFMFFVFQLSVSLTHATVMSSILGVLLTLGLTFSNRMRCLIFLLVPQLFSRVGRYTLTCYALVLILTGPATNTLKNSEVLSESMACSQEQIKLNVRQISESIKKPSNSIKDSLKNTVKKMNGIVRNLKSVLIRTNKLILSIASIIQSGYAWLISMADACNEALETPHQKCMAILKEYSGKTTEHYNLNNIKLKNSRKNYTNAIRDMLHAMGIKNVKPRKQFGFDADSLKKDKNKTDFRSEVIKKFEALVDHKDSKIDTKWSTNKDKMPGQFTEPKGANSKHSVRKKTKRSANTKDHSANRTEAGNIDKPWFLNKAYIAQTTCASLRKYKKFCVAANFAEDTFLATIKNKLQTFVRCISNLIHVKLNIQHTYTFIGNSSSSNQIAAGIVTEIRNRADPIFTWLSWSSCVTSLFLLLIIFRAKHYQHMFETRSRFDNRFITKEFRELDLKRLREGRETVLPLNTRERAKYVTTTSFRLVASEKFHLNRSAVFMTVATFKLLIHVVADYSLFWVLTTIRHHGKMHSPLQPGSSETEAEISGTGVVANILQGFVDAMYLQLSFPPSDHSCLPNPYPPDVKRYCEIGFLIFLLWFFALFEPYGLRLRHLIMGHYRPQRAKDRAVWLYNHLLRTRASFMKFARRKLHREFKYSSLSKFTIRRCLETHTLFRWISYLFRIRTEEPHCLLCSTTEDTSDPNKELIRCEVPNCPGTYCLCCFSDIGQLCTICLSPSDYGDLSDVSLEKGSDKDNSDDDSDPNDDGPSGSFKGESNSNYYTLEDANEPEAFSKRSFSSKQRQQAYFLGRIRKKDSDTLPLLKHLDICDADNDKEQKHKTKPQCDAVEKAILDININCFLQLSTTYLFRLLKREYYKDTILKELYNMNHCNLISNMDIFQYSLYYITKNPLTITKARYTTNVAKYLRRQKFIRHRKYVQRHSNYFMTCSNNNINTINEKGYQCGKNNQKNVKNLKKNKQNANSDVPDNEPKGLFNGIESENYESKTKSVLKTKQQNIHREHQSIICKYWNNMISTIMLERYGKKTKEKIPLNKQNKHKRKKKRKFPKNLQFDAKSPELGDNSKSRGDSRLFAFLDEREWVNCYDNLNKKIHTAEGEIKLKNKVITTETITINNVIIPKLQLDLSCDSQIKVAKQETSRTIKKDNSKHSIEKFFKSVVCNSCDLFGRSPKDDDERDNRYYNVPRSPSPQIALGPKQDQVQIKKTEACPDSDSSPAFKDILPEYAGELDFARISNPLLQLKQRCSSLFLRKSKDKLQDTNNKAHHSKVQGNKDFYPNKGKAGSKEEKSLVKGKSRDKKDIGLNKSKIQDRKDFRQINGKSQQRNDTKQMQDKTEDRNKKCSEDQQDCKNNDEINNKVLKQDKIEVHDRSHATSNALDMGHIETIMHDFEECLQTVRNKVIKSRKACHKNFNKPLSTVINVLDRMERKNRDAKKYNKDIQTIQTMAETDDKGVTALPMMISCGCQNTPHFIKTQDFNVQVNFRKHKKTCKYRDEQIMTSILTSTCASQYQELKHSEDSGTVILKQANDNHNLNGDSSKEEPSSETSTDDDESKSVTTVCSYANVDVRTIRNEQMKRYAADQLKRQKDRDRLERQRDQKQGTDDKVYKCKVGRLIEQHGRTSVKVVTKSNRSTLTDQMPHCDASTATDDWWSPLVERKKMLKKDNRQIEVRRKDYGLPRIRERRTFRNRGISTADKMVSFKSRAQFIPSVESVFNDVMTPSRYLLESQRYYNEIYCTKFPTPRVYPIMNMQRNHNLEKDRSQVNSGHYRRRGRKTKRLEESYSLRKDYQPGTWTKHTKSPETTRPSKMNH